MRVIQLAMVCVAVMIATAGQSNAGIISGVHIIDLGGGITKTVNLSGLDWLTWDETRNLSVLEVETQIASGTLSGFRYATRSEFEALFDSIYEVEGFDEDNLPGAQWLLENFVIPEINDDFTVIDIAFGRLQAPANQVFLGRFALGTVPAGTAGKAAFWDEYGLSLTNSQETYPFLDQPGFFEGHALIRISAVPEPTSIAIFGALCFVASGRRRAKRSS